MDINFEYYKIFYYVAKYKNITKAAFALGSNQPNVTRVMKLLESQLNTRLFVREPRGVSLTEEGEKLYFHVEAACRHLFYGQEEIFGRNLQETGTVEIGATESALHLFLLDVLHGFKARYPEIRIKIHNHNTPDIIKELMDGKLDLALITTPFPTPKQLFCETMLDFKEILAGGRQYKDRWESPVNLWELKDCPWIGLGKGTATYELYRAFFEEHHTKLELDVEVASSDLLLPLIGKNLGIGFVPESLAVPFWEEESIVQIPLNHPSPKRSIEVVFDPG